MDRQQPWRGIGLILAAVFMFALSDVVTKYLTTRWPVPFVLAVRYLINATILLAIYLPTGGAALFRTRRTGLVLVRAGSLSVASIAVGLALRHMPVGETIAIVYLAPLAVMILAVPLLGERVTPLGWAAVMLGLAGVLLIVRPGGGLSAQGVAFALLCAAATAVYQMLSRLLSRTESTQALLVFTALAGLAIFAALLPFNLPDRAVPPFDIAALTGLGLLATLGHVLFTAAYREAPAATLAPFNYVQLIWSAGLGWLAFGHLPDPLALAGIGMVTLGGMLAALGSARGRRPNPADVPGPG